MKQWYVLHTQMHKEQSVVHILQQRGLEAYCPTVPSKSSNALKQFQPFFPCYVFINTNISALDQTKWRWITGLRTVVSLDGKPTAMPDNAMSFIKEQLSSYQQQIQTILPSFQPGETVRVKDGPFENLYGIFDKECSPHDRVQVLLDFLGKSTKVQLSPEQLERAPLSSQHQDTKKRRRRTRGSGRRIKYKDVIS